MIVLGGAGTGTLMAQVGLPLAALVGGLATAAIVYGLAYNKASRATGWCWSGWASAPWRPR